MLFSTRQSSQSHARFPSYLTIVVTGIPRCTTEVDSYKNQTARTETLSQLYLQSSTLRKVLGNTK